MLMTQWQMTSAANQLRGMATSMQTIVNEMTAPGVWSGADADRFGRDWNDQITQALYRAATRLDSVDFTTLDEP